MVSLVGFPTNLRPNNHFWGVGRSGSRKLFGEPACEWTEFRQLCSFLGTVVEHKYYISFFDNISSSITYHSYY
jgi:hypothetical protein